MSEFDIVYLLAGVLLVLVVALGLWQIRGRRSVRRDRYSALTEVEEARRKMLH